MFFFFFFARKSLPLAICWGKHRLHSLQQLGWLGRFLPFRGCHGEGGYPKPRFIWWYCWWKVKNSGSTHQLRLVQVVFFPSFTAFFLQEPQVVGNLISEASTVLCVSTMVICQYKSPFVGWIFEYFFLCAIIELATVQKSEQWSVLLSGFEMVPYIYLKKHLYIYIHIYMCYIQYYQIWFPPSELFAETLLKLKVSTSVKLEKNVYIEYLWCICKCGVRLLFPGKE